MAEDILAFVVQLEALPVGQAGRLVFSGLEAPLGEVYVEQGRVCLVVESTVEGRLRQLLQPSAPTQAQSPAMRSLMARAQTAQELLRLYRDGDRVMRPALLEHCCDALDHLLRVSEGPAVWVPRSRHSGRFSFDGAEVLAGLSRCRAGLEISDAELGRHFDGTASAIAFTRPARGPSAVVDARDALGLGVLELMGLASWAERRLQTAQQHCPGAHLMLAEYEGQTRIAWNRGELVLAAVTQEPQVCLQIIASSIRAHNTVP